ncbi:unnamed protein product [Linum trigynum]|uniref:Uncharacterized protein n=1 Tax=Linum trigynum TaxID=586398 RepID=A0AAV2EVU3_9ROSI
MADGAKIAASGAKIQTINSEDKGVKWGTKIATCSAKISVAIFCLLPVNLTSRLQPQVHGHELWRQGCELQEWPTREKHRVSTVTSQPPISNKAKMVTLKIAASAPKISVVIFRPLPVSAEFYK